MNAKSGTGPNAYLDDNEQSEYELEEFPEDTKDRSEQKNISDYSLRKSQTTPFSSNIKMVRTKTVIYGMQCLLTDV